MVIQNQMYGLFIDVTHLRHVLLLTLRVLVSPMKSGRKINTPSDFNVHTYIDSGYLESGNKFGGSQLSVNLKQNGGHLHVIICAMY